jgi:hypothetical protein
MIYAPIIISFIHYTISYVRARARGERRSATIGEGGRGGRTGDLDSIDQARYRLEVKSPAAAWSQSISTANSNQKATPLLCKFELTAEGA